MAVCPPKKDTPVQAHICLTILLCICSPPPSWAAFDLHITGIRERIAFARSLLNVRHESLSSRPLSNHRLPPYRITTSFGPDGIFSPVKYLGSQALMGHHNRLVQPATSSTWPGCSHLQSVTTRDPCKQKRTRCKQNPSFHPECWVARSAANSW